MSDLWLTVGIPATAGLAATVYATGGRAALARRAIKEELDVAALLPAGDARRGVELMAEEKALLYAARWIGPQPLTTRQHVVLGTAIGVGALTAWAAARGIDELDVGWLSSLLLLVWITGMALVAMAFATWVSLGVMADNARSRSETVQTRRDRVRLRLAQPADATQVPSPTTASSGPGQTSPATPGQSAPT